MKDRTIIRKVVEELKKKVHSEKLLEWGKNGIVSTEEKQVEELVSLVETIEGSQELAIHFLREIGFFTNQVKVTRKDKTFLSIVAIEAACYYTYGGGKED